MTELRTDPRYRFRIKDLTPLNQAVNLLYAACQSGGGCKPGKRLIVRDDLPMAICERCGVPVRTQSLSVWRRRAAVWGA